MKKVAQAMGFILFAVFCFNWNTYLGSGCLLLSWAAFLSADNA